MGKYVKIKRRYTQEDVKKAKNDYVGWLLLAVIVALCMLFFFYDAITREAPLETVKESEYKEFVFVEYEAIYRRRAKDKYLIYVEDEEKPLYVDTRLVSRRSLDKLEKGVKLKCRVIKQSDKSKYSYTVIQLETRSRVFFTTDDYVRIANEANSLTIIMAAAFGVLTVGGILATIHTGKRYCKVKELYLYQ